MTLEIYLTNLTAYSCGDAAYAKWVALPASPQELDAALREIHVGPDDEYFIPDVSSDVDGAWTCINENTSLAEVNELAYKLDELSASDLLKIEAIIEAESPSLENLLQIFYDIDDYDLLTDVHDDEELGRYLIDELCALTVPDNLIGYFDFDAYGRDLRLEGNITDTTHGYLIAP